MIQALTLLGALGMFLYGMNLMSAGLQKAAGGKMRSFLTAMTSNPFKGVMSGLGITAVIQSSSATTVMTVGFVNAGLLTLSQVLISVLRLLRGWCHYWASRPTSRSLLSLLWL